MTCTCPVPSATAHICSEQPQGFVWVEVAAASRLAEQEATRRAEAAEAIVGHVREMAKIRAISCRALGNADAEREWLDVLAIVDGADR